MAVIDRSVEFDATVARRIAVSSAGEDVLYALGSGTDVVYAHVEGSRLVPWQMTLSTGPIRPRPPLSGRWVEQPGAGGGVPLPRFLKRSA